MKESEFLQQCAEVAAPICGSPIDFDLDFLGDYAEKIGVALWERHVRQWLEKRADIHVIAWRHRCWEVRDNRDCLLASSPDFGSVLLAAVQVAKGKIRERPK